MRHFLLLTLFVNAGGCAAPSQVPSPHVIVAASNMLHPPFSSWNEEGRAVGLEVEIVESAAASLNSEVRWMERPFPELLEAVANREIDIAVSTIGITSERNQLVAFSDPYFETQIVALVRTDYPSSAGLEGLAKGKIGADRSTTSFTAARQQWPTATIVGEVESGKTWTEMVHTGSIDAFIVDASDQERLQSQSGIMLHRLAQPLAQESFGVALAHENFAMRVALNREIAQRTQAD